MNHRLRGPGLHSMLALTFAVLVGAAAATSGCAHSGEACVNGTKGAKCRWERGRKAAAGESSDDVEADFAGQQDPLGTGGIWGEVEQVLLLGQEALSQGFAGEMLAAALAERCETTPLMKETDAGRAWTCPLAAPIAMYNGAFVLEVGEHGIVSLTARNLEAADANRFIFVAKNRWKYPRWCTEEISKPDHGRDIRDAGPSETPAAPAPGEPDGESPDAADSRNSAARAGDASPPPTEPTRGASSWRCALPDRLALVAAQFPQPRAVDGKELWQVSLAVVGTR